MVLAACCSDPPPPGAPGARSPVGDLSTLPVPDLRVVNERTISAGQPTAEALAQAKALGVELVVNLRSLEEDPGFDERATVESLGMRYVHIPMKGGESLTQENLAAFAQALSSTSGGALLHCRTGNRVGALWALDAAHNRGKSVEEALAEGRQAGLTKLEGAVRAHLTR